MNPTPQGRVILNPRRVGDLHPRNDSGSQPVAVVAAVSGLSRDTDYVFRLVATNNLGTTLGSELHFRTLPQPPIATTQPATEITAASATLNGSVNPNASVPATAFFQWGTTTNYGNTTPVQTVAGGTNVVGISASIAGLSPESSYHFRLVATNAGGTTLGADQTLQTAPLPPVATTGLVTGIGTNAATLNGMVNPNASISATVFFEWGVTTNYENATAAQIIPRGTGDVVIAAPVAGLSPGTSYHFRVVATNVSGTSFGSDGVFQTMSVIQPTSVVSVCDEEQLRAAVAGGTNVTFACDGTIVLANTLVISHDTILDASGHNVVISGNSLVRVFQVNPGVKLTLSNLGVTGGFSSNGAAIYNSGTLTLLHVDFSNNVARPTVTGLDAVLEGQGGAIFNDHGTVAATNCQFVGNVAQGSSSSNSSWVVFALNNHGQGGAIYNDSGGQASFSECAFVGNGAQGVLGLQHLSGGVGSVFISGGPGSRAQGGAIFNEGTLLMSNCTLSGNTANGGNGQDTAASTAFKGGDGGTAHGGGVWNSGTATVWSCSFISNSVAGGSGGSGGVGGGVGSVGGSVSGGGIHDVGTLTLSGCTLSQNAAYGGNAGRASDGGVTLSISTLIGLPGGTGGSGGAAQGGGIYEAGGTLRFTNSTLAANAAVGGAAAAGGKGGGEFTPGGPSTVGGDGGIGGLGGNVSGGAIFATNASAVLVNCTIADNSAQPGTAGAAGTPACGRFGICGQAGVPGTNGVALATAICTSGSSGGGFLLLNSALAAGSGAANCSGSLADGGHNLCSDNSAAFSAPGSRNNSNPQLSPLANNGGPTLTMALLPGSSAIDAGIAVTGITTDQRGFARPFGPAPDIGAFEFGAVFPPIANTQPATEISAVSATLNGTVNPGASVPATVFFEWGATTNYGNVTLPHAIGSGPDGVPVSAVLAGLSPETSYHFRLVATNVGGTTRGTGQTFQTPALPVVTVCDEAHLRAAMQAGGTVTFACDGIIVLADTLRITNDAILDASGHSVTISGNNVVRLFEVPAGKSLTLTNLTLANGRSTNGGAIFNEGTLSANLCTLVANAAVGVNGNTWPVTNATEGRGGAISSYGTAGMDRCVFVNNSAQGGIGAYDHPSTAGKGGAIYSSGPLTVSACTFQGNTVTGSKGSLSGFFSFAGGQGSGGAIQSDGSADVLASTFVSNQAHGGEGADAPLASSASSAGGNGLGGAISSSGTLNCTNNTFQHNTAIGGMYGAARWGPTGGSGLGGALYVGSNTTVLSFCTLAGNLALPATTSVFATSPGVGAGGGIYGATGAAAMLHSSIIAYHTQGGDIAGTVTDLGHNICSDGSASLTNASSLKAIDPQLGPLQDNGGPTLTMALLQTSPAIGRGDTANSPATDQRGVARPQNGSSDPGAVEFVGPPPRVLQLASASYSVVEGQPELVVTVTCSGPLDGLVTVQCGTVEGTAKASLDYVTTNLVLSFASGETSKTFKVQIVNDDILEENETLQLVLSNPTGSSALDSPSNAVLTIVDQATPSGVCSGAQLLAAASQGGEVLFGCNGTFVLTNTIVVTNALTIDGRLRTVTISGNNTVRLFKVMRGGSLTLRNLILTGGYATDGGAIFNDGGVVEIEMCRFDTNHAAGPWGDDLGLFGHHAQSGTGGAVCNVGGIVHIRATTFYGNVCSGGNGVSSWITTVNGAPGMGGALFNSGIMSLSEVALTANRANGGAAYGVYSVGADGFGGAVYNVGVITLTNSTIHANAAVGGYSGRINRLTISWGGGFFNGGGTAVVQNVTIANNITTATGSVVARGNNIAVNGGQIELANTIIAGALDRTTSYGILVDLGHNISSDGSCGFTNVGSLNNTNPSLAPLADNGGPTLTMALFPDSPAIDAGVAVAGITTDQRGFARPFGSAPDIGAFEFGAVPPTVGFRLGPLAQLNGTWQLQLLGPPGALVRLQLSTNLSTWSDVATYTMSIEGFLLLPLPSPTAPQHFYRTVSP